MFESKAGKDVSGRFETDSQVVASYLVQANRENKINSFELVQYTTVVVETDGDDGTIINLYGAPQSVVYNRTPMDAIVVNGCANPDMVYPDRKVADLWSDWEIERWAWLMELDYIYR